MSVDQQSTIANYFNFDGLFLCDASHIITTKKGDTTLSLLVEHHLIDTAEEMVMEHNDSILHCHCNKETVLFNLQVKQQTARKRRFTEQKNGLIMMTATKIILIMVQTWLFTNLVTPGLSKGTKKVKPGVEQQKKLFFSSSNRKTLRHKRKMLLQVQNVQIK
eukprot:6629800-Ditylum_brightwellii.AAC.1